MGLFDSFPYTNFHELNMEWVLRYVKNLDSKVEEYMAINKISYGGPWDIRKSYPKWSIVSDNGRAFISIENTPGGVELENEKYWVLAGDLDPRIESINTYLDNNRRAFYNVLDYGAKGDGVSDDTTAIQNTIDSAMENGGGAVVLPSGEYKITSPILIRPHTPSVDSLEDDQTIHFIKMDKLQLFGLGECVIKAHSTMRGMIETRDLAYPSGTGSFSNFYTEIHGLKLDGMNNAQYGIYLDHALHSLPTGNVIYHVKRGIFARGYGEMTIQDNVIKAAEICMEFESSGDNNIIGNDLYVPDGAKCIVLRGWSGSTTVQRNTFTPINPTTSTKIYGVYMEDGTWSGAPAYLTSVRVHDNSFDGVYYAVFAKASSLGYVADIEVYGNKYGRIYARANAFTAENVVNCRIHDNIVGVAYNVNGDSGYIAHVRKSERVIVANNEIQNSGETPIIFTDCINCSAFGNHISNWTLGNQDGAAILIDGDSFQNFVESNTLFKDRTDSGQIGVKESGNAGYNTGDNFIKGARQFYDVNVLTSRYRNVSFDYNPPTDGQWNVGDIVFNMTNGADVVGWRCKVAGTPGTWQAFS